MRSTTHNPFGEIDTEGRDVVAASSAVQEPMKEEAAATGVSVTIPEGENVDSEKDLV